MLNSVGVITTSASFSGNNFTTFGEDINGELYIAGITSGTIYKIIDSSLSNTDFETNGFSIYPNPAKESFVLKSTEANLGTKIDIFDVTGKLLFSKKLNENIENTISTNSMSNGIYLISIESTSGLNFRTKLVIE